MLCPGGVGLHHLQTGVGKNFLRVDPRRFVARGLLLHRLFHAWLLDPRLFDARLFDTRLLDMRLFGTRLLHMPHRSGFHHRLMVGLRFGLGLALHLQTVLLELLRVYRLFGALVLLDMFRPALATFGTIAPFGAATSTAAAVAPSAAWLLAIRARRTIAVFGTGVRALLHRRARLLLLRTRMPLLFGPPLCLRLLLCLLRNFSPRLLAIRAVRAVRARRLLLRRALIAPRLLFALCICITVAALLLVRTAAAAVALVVAATFATSAAPVASTITSAAPSSTTSAAPVLMPVARFVATAVGALRPWGMHAWFVGC